MEDHCVFCQRLILWDGTAWIAPFQLHPDMHVCDSKWSPMHTHNAIPDFD